MRLFEQQMGEIGNIAVPAIRLGIRDGLDQRMLHVEFENGLRAGRAIGLGENALEASVRPRLAGNEAGRAVRQPLRGADIRYAFLEGGLDRGDHDGFIDHAVLVRILGFGGFVLQQRHKFEIDVALAQGLQRFAVVLVRVHRPECIDVVREQENFDPARAGGLEIGVGA